MHFGKEYSALLSSLPGELSAHAVNYRQVSGLFVRRFCDLKYGIAEKDHQPPR
jgi:hypothetical protein